MRKNWRAVSRSETSNRLLFAGKESAQPDWPRAFDRLQGSIYVLPSNRCILREARMAWSLRSLPNKTPAQVFALAALFGRTMWKLPPVRYFLGAIGKWLISPFLVSISPAAPYRPTFVQHFHNNKERW